MNRFNANINLQGTYMRGRDFQVERRLGGGGQASVWLANEMLDYGTSLRKVALKVFLIDERDYDRNRATDAFKKDIEFLSQFGQQGLIVPYFGNFFERVLVTASGNIADKSADGSDSISILAFVIVMAYADGGCLDSHEYRSEKVVNDSSRSFIGHFIDVCRGLRAAHDSNIVHKDIKPSNLMWFRSVDKVMIGDFGIAENIEKSGTPDMMAEALHIVGTPAYMSPESWEPGFRPRPERDIYALGCTFYEIVTGRQAFPSNATKEDHASQERPDPIIFEEVRSLITPEVGALIRDMMAVEPARRPSMDSIIRTLQNEQPSVARPRAIERIPNDPIFRSTHYLNPSFRIAATRSDGGASQELFFLFITMNIQSRDRYNLLYRMLTSYFSETFSLWEVYGHFSFVVRVWAYPDTCHAFCDDVLQQLLDRESRNIQVFWASQVRYLGCDSRPRAWGDVGPAIGKIYQAQNIGSEDSQCSAEAKEAQDWLHKERIYVRQRPRQLGPNAVKCVCLVRLGQDEDHREAAAALIADKFQLHLSPSELKNVSIYLRSERQLTGIASNREDFVITYITKNFRSVQVLPMALIEHIHEHHLRIHTLLATGRIFIDSDDFRTDGRRRGTVGRSRAAGDVTGGVSFFEDFAS